MAGLSSCMANVFCGATTFPLYEALPLTPQLRNSKCGPNIPPSALQQVEPVRIGRDGELECEAAPVASAMPNQFLRYPASILRAVAAGERNPEVLKAIGLKSVGQHTDR